ncbi:tryptophan 7-halogenase [Porticoccaceae bacterium LTM1]|nr:tryptophan 7-halogenase [Porticoccaceae bacterium LTM1]
MMPKESIGDHIVILGGGTAGWMAANLFAHEFGDTSNITLIESSSIGTVGVGEGSTPYFVELFRKLNIPESEWMPACNATYKCGISFYNWCEEPEYIHYSHPFFSQHDSSIGQHFLRNCHLRRAGIAADVNARDFFLSSELARTGKAPHTKTPSNLNHDYSYHFDAGLLGNFLKEKAIGKGVKHIVDTVSEVTRKECGDIEALITSTHGAIAGDLFIDCSGFSGLLINKVLNVPFLPFDDCLFNDSAIAIPTPIEANKLPSETTATALSNGWAWKIPLTSRNGNGYVYSSAFTSADQAEQELRNHLGASSKDAPARHLKMRIGRVEAPWNHNCIAIGLAQGFVEPLEATAISFTLFSLNLFIDKLQKSGLSIETQKAYNEDINRSFDGVRDYIALHYKLNTRSDSDYWKANRESSNTSDTLNSILAAWDDSNSNFDYILQQLTNNLIFPRTSWYCLLAGKGRFNHKSTLSNQITLKADQARLICQKLAEQFHDQREYLSQLSQEK